MHAWKHAAVAALLAALPMGAAQATVSYALAGTIVSDDTPQSFTYFSPGVVTHRTDLLPSDLAFVVNADEVVFLPDAPANAQVPEASDAWSNSGEARTGTFSHSAHSPPRGLTTRSPMTL